MKNFIWKKYFFIFLLSIISIGYTNSDLIVFMVGDSTMAIFNLPDLRVGWGQKVSQFFNSSVSVINVAKSGRSTKSYIDEGYWTNAINRVKEGDYVVIQFGHNDEKSDSTRHTDPYTTYTTNLKQFVDETRARGGIPVLCTPIVRRYFNPDGTVKFSHGDYPDAVRKLAYSMNVPMVDMELKTKALVESYGPDSSKLLYNYVEPGVSSYYPNGNSDDTHLNALGAEKVAHLFVEGVQELNLDLSKYVKVTAGDEVSLYSPKTFWLSQNYPNPFNPSTNIRFAIPEESNVLVNIYNILGQQISTLVDKSMKPGIYDYNFDASGLSGGIYFYSISTDDYNAIKKMLLLK
jgi:lysophospholipase L1-like esterase